MRRLFAIVGSAVFFVIAPCFIAGLVPFWISRWIMQPPLLGLSVMRVAGGILILAGLPLLLDSFARFAIQGVGTPAPVFPTKHLVITGWYRYVRNPMYVAVTSEILGQGLLFGNTNVLWYGAAVALAFHLFVLGYEEPTLRASFGDDYRRYCENVPRWIPRLTAWRN